MKESTKTKTTRVCVQPLPSAVNVTLPAFAAERWRLLHGLSIDSRALSSKPAARR